MSLIGAQIAFWTLAPLLSQSAPPLDVVEMYAWGREGVVATFKHPNLPGLTLEAFLQVTGLAGWPAYLISQLCIAATFVCVFALGRDMLDARRALAGTLLLTGVYFFSWPTPEFNHNVAQMPLWALATWLLWRATTKDGKLWVWAILGLAAGFSLWAKYSSGVLLGFAPLWLMFDAQARRTLATPGPYVALAAFIASAAPQALWLLDHDFQPFAYAARRASRDASLFAPFEFLLTQALHHLPMLIVMAAAGLFAKAPAADLPESEARGRRFLLMFGLGPPLAIAAAALLAGAGLKSAWAAPMLNLSGLIAMAWLGNRLTEDRARRVAIGAGVLIVLISGLYFAHMRFGPDLSGKPLRGHWPQAEISAGMEAAWAEQTGGAPLKIVAGDIFTAGLIGLTDRDPPSVWINRDLSISPWISPARVRREGALMLWRADEPPPAWAEGFPAEAVREASFPFPGRPKLAPITLFYVVARPEPRDEANAAGG